MGPLKNQNEFFVCSKAKRSTHTSRGVRCDAVSAGVLAFV